MKTVLRNGKGVKFRRIVLSQIDKPYFKRYIKVHLLLQNDFLRLQI